MAAHWARVCATLGLGSTFSVLAMRLVKYEHPTKGIWPSFIGLCLLACLLPLGMYLAIRFDTKHPTAANPYRVLPAGCGPPIVGAIVNLRSRLFLRGHGAFISDEGVGALRDGDQAWVVPWSRFGGYRRIRQTMLQWTLQQHRAGIEILDREES